MGMLQLYYTVNVFILSKTFVDIDHLSQISSVYKSFDEFNSFVNLIF